MLKYIIIIYIICWLLACYIGYKIGFMEEYCRPDPWGEEDGTPSFYIIMMFLSWWLFLIVFPIVFIFDKIDDFFYKKWKK